MESMKQYYPDHEEQIARVTWAVHILSYVVNQRSSIELFQPDTSVGEGDDDIDEHGNVDAETERMVVLHGTNEAIRSGFLNCIAQLFSPAKGWEGVVATAMRDEEDVIVIDVARNDYFGANVGQNSLEGAETEYCRQLEDYLAQSHDGQFQDPQSNLHDKNSAHYTPLSNKFELLAIAYLGQRLDELVARYTKLLISIPERKSKLYGHYKSLSMLDAWTRLADTLRQTYNATNSWREKIVQQAYDCVVSKDIHDAVFLSFTPEIASKIWRALRLMARPLLDCWMLQRIASQVSRFRNVRIHLLRPTERKGIASQYKVEISQAWDHLIPSDPNPFVDMLLAKHRAQFKKDCAKEYGMHAEMQLYMHYENNPGLGPDFPYFGCSKKACLLCDSFLRALPSPVATRGSHGVCYPAWGIPRSSSAPTMSALRLLESALVSRIADILNNPAQAHKPYFVLPKPQSTIISSLSSDIIKDQTRHDTRIQDIRKLEKQRIESHRIREGYTAREPTPLPDFDPYKSCVMCNATSAELCGQCMSSWYCSEACRIADLPSHELLCKDFLEQSPRPSDNSKRAIFFPVKGGPRMIWLPCERKRDDDDRQSFEKLKLHPYLGDDDPSVGSMYIEHNPIRDRNLGSWPLRRGYILNLEHRECYLTDGSLTNESIRRSTSSGGIPPHRYCGPMVAVRSTPFETYEDITLNDFRHLIDYLLAYGSTEARESTNSPAAPRTGTVRGIKICCYGEEKLHGSEPFVPVDVSRAHPTRLESGNCEISPISRKLGMPIKLWKEPNIEQWLSPPGWEENMNAESNPNVAFLMTELDVNKEYWGWVPPNWTRELGNVVAVRADNKDLTVDDMRTMALFARRRLQPLFEDAIGAGLVERTKQEVLDFITWDNMQAYRHETGLNDGTSVGDQSTT